MIFMHILRIMADFSFYGAFAGFFAAYFIGEHTVTGVLLLPLILYLIWHIWKKAFVLDYYRQYKLFSAFWKAMLVFIPVAMLFGGTVYITTITLPFALITLASSILLLRSLRHDPKIYCQRNFQIVNVIGIVGMLVLAYLLSSDLFLRSCMAVLNFINQRLLQPTLELFLYAWTLLIWLVYKLYSMLPISRNSSISGESMELTVESANDIFGNDIQNARVHPAVNTIAWIIFTVVIIVLAIMFVRWLNRREGYEIKHISGTRTREKAITSPSKRRERDTSSVRKIRSLYKDFLKWGISKGMPFEPDFTSLDVQKRMEHTVDSGNLAHPSDSDDSKISSNSFSILGQIREVYIKARYAGQADANSVKKMKELCKDVKRLP